MDYAALLGAEPDGVVKPSTVEEGAAVVARANKIGKAVIPWGGGTGQDYGYLPRRADIVLDLTGMNRILAHEPGDLTVTVQPGVTWAQVQATLAEHRQFLPLDPPNPERATLGGILAVNAWGPSRLGYGTARDWLIGLSVVDAQGRLVKGGGKVVKNVTGYDLPKLHIGALGTLGIIVEATFKVSPMPEASAALIFQAGDGADMGRFLSRLHDGHAPTASALSIAPSGLRIDLRFSGPREVVDAATAAATRLAEEYGLAPDSGAASAQNADAASASEAPVRVRLSGRASDACTQHLAAREAFPDSAVVTQTGTGHTDLLRDGDFGALASWARDREASYSVVKAPASLRAGDFDLWRPLPPGFALMRRMKETLDPNGTLNPGRFVGKL